jgi:hypothetical protein
VATVRRELVAAGAIAARPPRPDVAVQANGNLTRQAAGDPGPALKHGAWSERTLAELRTRHLEDLRQRFPDADESLLRVQAGRLSRHEALTDFLDRAGVSGLVTKAGSLKPAAALIARLEDAIERCHGRLTGVGANGADPYEEYRKITQRREQT